MTRRTSAPPAPPAPSVVPPAILDRRVSRRDVLRVLGLGAVTGVIAACGSSAVTFAPGESATAAASATSTAAPTAVASTAGVPATAVATATPAPSAATPGPTPAPTAVPSPPDTPAPSPTARPRGGTIRVGAVERGFDQGWLTWKATGLEYAWNWCAQRLVSVAPDGTVVHDLAARHTVSADGRAYTFELVPGATWHDGRPVTAADVAFTFNTALKAAAGSTVASLLAPIQGAQAVIEDNTRDAAGIVVVDDRTIRFVLDRPNASVLPTLFGALFVMPKHPFAGVALADFASLPAATTRFIGSGPMQVSEVRGTTVSLAAHDGYANGSGWMGRPAADRVTIQVLADDAALIAAANAGDVDFGYVRRPSLEVLRQLRAVPGMSVQASVTGFNVFYSFFLGDGLSEPPHPVVKQKAFRQATIWALDLPTLVHDVLGDVFRVPEVFDHWTAPWANSDRLVRYTPRDVAKAKALLAASGYQGETIVCGTYGREPDYPVIFQMWKDIGIATKQVDIPDASFFEDFYTRPTYDIAFAYGLGSLDGSPWGADSFLGSRSFPQAGGYNAFRFSDAEWDAEYAAALAAPDPAGQARHFRRCSEIFNDELPYVPLYQRVDQALVGATLHGPEQAPMLHPAVGGVRWWEWYTGF